MDTCRSISIARLWVLLTIVAIGLGCADEKRKKRVGDSCSDDVDCESGICYENLCLDPDGDLDGDGLKNGVEKNLTRTDAGKADTDGDGVPDGLEIGANINAPEDRDGDGLLDALESRLPQADNDGDCIPDEFDPRNNAFDEDNAVLVELGCNLRGVCGEGRARIVARCVEGQIQCDYAAVASWEAAETTCDALDNDCDGQTDNGALVDPAPDACPTVGVCGGEASPARACIDGNFVCVFEAVPGWQATESLCDGLDNDCDGETDEGLLDQECLVENEFGQCPGLSQCAEEGGGVVCVGMVPAPETCNGEDDNCDGRTDEGLAGEVCSRTNEFGTCQGWTACDDQGGTFCGAPVPALEVCNQVDDNCDGQTDENNVCGRTAVIRGQVFRAQGPIVVWRPPAMSAGQSAMARGEPLAGVEVRVGTGAACEGEVPPGPFYSALTNASGQFDLPVEPGEACLLIDADQFLSVRSDRLPLIEGDVLALEVALFPVDALPDTGTVCGRVLGEPLQRTGSPTPLGGVLVQAQDAEGIDLGQVSTNEQGLFCLAGLPLNPPDSTGVVLQFIRDGWFRSRTPVVVSPNWVTFLEQVMKPLPAEPSLCLLEDFEGSFLPGTDILEPPPWEATSTSTDVQWTWMQWTATNSAGGQCVQTPSEEICQTGSGCILCQEGQNTGCIPFPNALPLAYSGSGFYWFGNAELGNYLPFGQTCDSPGKPVNGTLASPWIEVGDAVDLVLTFATAWEVESRDLQMDRMWVEMQTLDQASMDLWVPVHDVKKGADNTGATSPRQGLSSGGLGRSPAWVTHQVALPGARGAGLVRLRFVFDSVDGADNAFRGWMIDDLRVMGRGCGLFVD